ncbi:hypothetical protein ACT3CD_12305 [Geofilum sp. OHC36d9]|uniref:hypothetical protein n=1 Tax=Geofilum sp. OHC36d9 TaxID=3458413 RepID=UPI004033ECD3
MTIRTFWILFLKVLGIWLVLSGLTTIPQFIGAISFFGDNSQDNFFAVIYILALLLIVVGAYFVIMKLFIFNSTWIIDKLKLDKGIKEEKIDMSISLKTILTISTIVIGGLILVDALPMLCKYFFTFIQQESLFRDAPQSNWIIFYSLKAFIGYLIMTNSKLITDYIKKNEENIEV